MSVKYIRFTSGENVIAEVTEENVDKLVLRNAIVAIPQSDTQMGFAPYAPLQDPELDTVEVDRLTVVFVTDPAPAIVDQYVNMFSNIITPTKKLIV